MQRPQRFAVGFGRIRSTNKQVVLPFNGSSSAWNSNHYPAWTIATLIGRSLPHIDGPFIVFVYRGIQDPFMEALDFPDAAQLTPMRTPTASPYKLSLYGIKILSNMLRTN